MRATLAFNELNKKTNKLKFSLFPNSIKNDLHTKMKSLKILLNKDRPTIEEITFFRIIVELD